MARLEQPRYEARELVRAFLELELSELITKEGTLLTPEQDREIKTWVQKRASGFPLAYLSGKKGFFKYEFSVEPGVLVPRPETELVVETALLRTRGRAVRTMADLGSGSGCIGLSVLKDTPDAKLWCLDESVKACGVTAKNATQLDLDDRVVVIHSAVEVWKPRVALDLIVANPPYIPVGDSRVQKSVHQFEPHEALYSGADGLDAIRSWSIKASGWLNREGVFVCEIGAGQSVTAKEIMESAGFGKIEIARDLAGIERVISGVKSYG